MTHRNKWEYIWNDLRFQLNAAREARPGFAPAFASILEYMDFLEREFATYEEETFTSGELCRMLLNPKGKPMNYSNVSYHTKNGSLRYGMKRGQKIFFKSDVEKFCKMNNYKIKGSENV